MSDASTLFWLAAASCVVFVVVAIAVAAYMIAVAVHIADALEDPGEDGPYGDWPSTPADFNLLHSAALADGAPHDPA